MIKKIITILTCLAIGVALFIPRQSRADDDLPVWRIAATISLEAGSNRTESIKAMEMVAQVIQERHKSQMGKATWAEILYGGEKWFEHSRGFASKSVDELITFTKKKSGSRWSHALHLAKQVYSHTLPKLTAQGYTINSFIQGYKNTQYIRNKSGKVIQTPSLMKDPLGQDYFYAALGDIHTIVKKSKLTIDEYTPRQSHSWDNAVVDRYIKGSQSYANDADVKVGDIPEGGYDGSSSGGGSSSSATPQKKPKGYVNRDQCALPEMQKIYMQSDGEDGTACWYCKVVIILANAYLQAASKAIPSAVGLGKIILKFGFLIWLAYYILQQVSSFAPVKISKVIQDILVMGFKVALAYFIMDSAQTFIVNYFIDPIGTFGTDYGSALFDKLHSTSG